jgi:riboflavin kinase/FMN adenylyltransferase
MPTLLTFSGRVIRGDGFGRILGFPTANLDRRSYARLPRRTRLGVYAGYARVGQRAYRAACVVGPLDSRNLPKLEAYLLGCSGSLYGKRLAVSLVSYLRPYRKFASRHALVAQIRRDVAACRRLPPPARAK